MKRLAALLTLVTLMAGCRAPMPSFDVLAPYGTTRVPPPATGTMGTPDTYYQAPASPAPQYTRHRV